MYFASYLVAEQLRTRSTRLPVFSESAHLCTTLCVILIIFFDKDN